jgi:hypothetical protein
MAVADDLAEFRARLDAAQLPTDDIIAQTRTQLRIVATPGDPVLGGSRLGGAPDLPRGVAWPRHRWPRTETESWPEWARDELAAAIEAGSVVIEGDRIALALPFVAQLDLAALAPLQDVLPRRGHLWLFADQSSTLALADGYPVVASACLHAEQAELVAVEPPPVPEDFACAAITFTPRLALPEVDDLFLTRDDSERYRELLMALDASPPRHALLPRADHGTTRVPPARFTPVLKIDSDDHLRMCWGDAAWITFALPEDALAAARFDEMHAFRFIG